MVPHMVLQLIGWSFVGSAIQPKIRVRLGLEREKSKPTGVFGLYWTFPDGFRYPHAATRRGMSWLKSILPRNRDRARRFSCTLVHLRNFL